MKFFAGACVGSFETGKRQITRMPSEDTLCQDAVVEMRNSADAVGYPCSRTASTQYALTVAVSCASPTRKPVADAARSSVRHAFSSIERSTRSPLTWNAESEKGLKAGNKTFAPFVLKSSFNGVTSLD